MQQVTVHLMMDGFYTIVNTVPVEDAPSRILRHAGTGENVVAMEALARLLVVESARRRHAEACLAEAKRLQEG